MSSQMQLELGSVEGTLSLAESRIWRSVQGDLEKLWRTLNSDERLNSTVG